VSAVYRDPGDGPRASTPLDPPSNGATASAPGGGADLFTAIQQVTNHAMSGGLRSKQRAFKTLEDAFDYISQQLATFARQLSEPGQEYPASIWEPLATAAAHVKAAASAAGESSSGLGALAGMNLGEAADSSVHVPHNTQLNAGS
jgi:chaperonin GroEL (HSP60 family)